MAYTFDGFDPMKSRMNDLIQRRAAIDQELNTLRQAPAPININNMMPQPQMQQSFDFNGRWVDNEEQAKQIANNNLPLILFDNNNPIFYMKEVDGTLKKYRFEEIIPEPPKDVVGERITNLENQISTLISALGIGEPQTETPPQTPEPTSKANKGGKK